jgi:hypothetical protein
MRFAGESARAPPAKRWPQRSARERTDLPLGVSMASEEQTSPDEQELARHFEAILGREVPSEEVADLVFRVTVGLYTTENGFSTSRSFAGGLPPIKSCAVEQNMHTFGGLVTTRTDGKATFKLSDFHCSGSFVPIAPIILVATAHTRFPVFVTSFTTVVSTPSHE